MGEPCGWAITQCGCGTCWDGYSPAVQARAAALAIGVMWAATGRQYGLCPVTLMPSNPRPRGGLYRTYPVLSRTAVADWDGTAAMFPYIVDGVWRNACGSGCSCRTACGVELPGPVAAITAVLIDGDEVDPAAYQIHNRTLLVRIDGDCWPVCQTYGVAIPGFEVMYERGRALPLNVQAAAETLACEYAKACVGGVCALPGQLSSLSRQGVEVTIAQVDRSGPGLRTGIQVVDDAITAVNPANLTERPEVWSPDLPDDRVVTWQASS